MKKLYQLFFTIILLIPISFSFTQTYVSGVISTNTTWTNTGNDFIVTGDLTLLPGVTLTINEGVVIKINDGVTFNVRGHLIANGTSSNPIKFTSSSSIPTPGSWNTIFVQVAQGASLILYFCELSYASRAINVECCHGGGPIIIENSVFENNICAVDGYGGSTLTQINNCIFTNNSWGLGGADKVVHNSVFINNSYGASGGPGGPVAERMNFYDCTFEGNSVTAIELDGDNNEYDLNEIKRCEIKNNNIGIDTYFGRNAIVEGCSIHNNNIGIRLDFRASFLPIFNNTVHNNNIYNNITYNLENKSSTNMYVENNWWGTINTAIIDSFIYDVFDNTSRGLAVYQPFLTSPITSIENVQKIIFNQYTISQNYPNPFNPITKINYYIPQGNFVTLKVYDLLGKEISTLVNEEKSVGNYEVEFDGSSLPSGIYFYKMHAGSFFETKKLILLK